MQPTVKNIKKTPISDQAPARINNFHVKRRFDDKASAGKPMHKPGEGRAHLRFAGLGDNLFSRRPLRGVALNVA